MILSVLDCAKAPEPPSASIAVAAQATANVLNLVIGLPFEPYRVSDSVICFAARRKTGLGVFAGLDTACLRRLRGGLGVADRRFELVAAGVAGPEMADVAVVEILAPFGSEQRIAALG